MRPAHLLFLSLAAIVAAPSLVPSRALAQDCVHDDALARAAAELASRGTTPSASEILAVARREGSDAPTVHGLRVHGDAGAARVTDWLARIATGESPLACAHADTDEGALWLAAPRLGAITVLSTDPVRVRASFVVSTGAAVLYVLDGRGETSAYEVAGSPTEIELPEDLQAPLSLQLVAARPEGPRPVAERIVGDVREEAPLAEGASLESAIGGMRSRAEVSPLRSSHLLARLAQAHAEAVCREGRVAHVLSEGDAERRLEREGVVARHVGEVVARGRDESAAWRALASSPSHRGALLDRRFTDAGLGRATDGEGRTCVVVLLAAWPRRVR